MSSPSAHLNLAGAGHRRERLGCAFLKVDFRNWQHVVVEVCIVKDVQLKAALLGNAFYPGTRILVFLYC